MRPRLCGVLAEASVQLAVCKGWIGDQEGADHFAAMALDAARESGEPDLPVHVLISRTSGDRRLHDSPDLRLQRYVAGDYGFTVAGAGRATRAWAATRAADVMASLGQVEECLRALDEAAGLLAGAASRRYPWPDDPWLSGERGASLARLGRTAEARVALGHALGRTGEDRFVDRLWWKLAMARADAHDGDVEQAARTALDVLHAARRMRHGQLEDEVARFHARLSLSDGPEVRALDAALSREQP
jgi:hypothetical protein